MRNRSSLDAVCWLLPTRSTAVPQPDLSSVGSAQWQNEFPKLAAAFPREATMRN